MKQEKDMLGLVTDQLKEQLSPQEVIVYNIGINGQDSSELLQQLGQKNVLDKSKKQMSS